MPYARWEQDSDILVLRKWARREKKNKTVSRNCAIVTTDAAFEDKCALEIVENERENRGRTDCAPTKSKTRRSCDVVDS